MKVKRPDIVEEIKVRLKEKNMSKAAFAKTLGIHRQNVNKLVFDRVSLDTDMLIRISDALGHNFFEHFKCDEKCNTSDYTTIFKDVSIGITLNVGDVTKEGTLSLGKIEIK